MLETDLLQTSAAKISIPKLIVILILSLWFKEVHRRKSRVSVSQVEGVYIMPQNEFKIKFKSEIERPQHTLY